MPLPMRGVFDLVPSIGSWMLGQGVPSSTGGIKKEMKGLEQKTRLPCVSEGGSTVLGAV